VPMADCEVHVESLPHQTIEATYLYSAKSACTSIDSVNETNHILNDHPFDSQDLRIRTVDSC
jgi:hypothetical protein